MKLLLKNKLTILFLLLGFGITNPFRSQFAPAAGQVGTTAIHKDSSSFVNWATTCSVTLGPEDISDPQSNIVSTGNSTMTVGFPGNGTVSLGDGGTAVLTFQRKIINGPGWDFAVFENSFSDHFLELGYVEVSSNGFDFVRFPPTSLTQDTAQIDAFGSVNAEKINNLAGKYRANYGTPFDLEDLINEPSIDVNAISHVKIIDVIGSLDSNYCNFDIFNNKINDPWPTAFPSSGFDLDAVGIINEAPLSLNHILNNEIITNIIIKKEFIDLILNQNKTDYWIFNVINLSGQLVYNENILIDRDSHSKRISISNLNPGFYILNCQSESYNKSIKFISR